MAAIDNAEIIAGAKFRSWYIDGYWSDPFASFLLGGKDFSISVTYLPQGTLTMQATSIEDMVIEIKKGDKKFREASLSEESKAVFKDEKIDNKIEEMKAKILSKIKK